MTALWKWVLWVAGALLFAAVISMVFIADRHGSYPIFKASSFSNLQALSSDKAVIGQPVVQTASGALRGAVGGAAIAFR